MKLAKVKIIKEYRDVVLKRMTKVGEIIDMTIDRVREIESRIKGYIEIMGIYDDEPVIEEPKKVNKNRVSKAKVTRKAKK